LLLRFVALLVANTPGICRTVEAQMEAKSYVDHVSCRRWPDTRIPIPYSQASMVTKGPSGVGVT
jgi:hypothetical protein